MDIFNNSGHDNRTITGTEANDSIRNYGDNVTINALGGNDTIQSYGDNAVVDAGTGNDFIDGSGSNLSLNGGAGEDIFYNLSSNSTLIGGTGNDVFYNNLLYNIITQGRFYYWEEKWGYGNNLLFLYKEGDGEDIIYGSKPTARLQSSATKTLIKLSIQLSKAAIVFLSRLATVKSRSRARRISPKSISLLLYSKTILPTTQN